MFSMVIVAALAAAAQPPAPDVQRGFEGALRGCREWVLNPASWANGPAPFLKATDLGPQMGPVEHVDEVNLPPPSLRLANHYWRINSTLGAGYVLVVSDRLPMCHITGGGDTDLQPAVATVLSSPDFSQHWKLVKEEARGDMVSSRYQSLDEPRFSILISRAAKAGERLDRVQVMATGVLDLNK